MSKQNINQTYITNPQIGNKQNQTDKQLISYDVMEAYQKLHKNIDEVHIKVDHVISKHQSQFLLAYRSHIMKIQKQLGDIKKKSQDQQKMFSSNDRIKFLEKQITIFRQEALVVYEKLQKTSEQLQIYKRKYQDIIKQLQQSEKTAKQSIKNSKILQAKKAADDVRIAQLQQQLIQKQKQIQRLKHRKQCQQNRVSFNFRSLKSDTNSRTRYDRLSSSIIQTERKSIKLGDSQLIQENTYKDLFFQCVRKIKKQIAFRKGSPKMDLSHISNLDEFRELDKIKILQLFFSNPKLQMWLYQKLFQNSLFQKISRSGNIQQDKNSQMHMLTTTGGFMLPRVRQGQKRSISKLQNKNVIML